MCFVDSGKGVSDQVGQTKVFEVVAKCFMQKQNNKASLCFHEVIVAWYS